MLSPLPRKVVQARAVAYDLVNGPFDGQAAVIPGAPPDEIVLEGRTGVQSLCYRRVRFRNLVTGDQRHKYVYAGPRPPIRQAATLSIVVRPVAEEEPDGPSRTR